MITQLLIGRRKKVRSYLTPRTCIIIRGVKCDRIFPEKYARVQAEWGQRQELYRVILLHVAHQGIMQAAYNCNILLRSCITPQCAISTTHFGLLRPVHTVYTSPMSTATHCGDRSASRHKLTIIQQTHLLYGIPLWYKYKIITTLPSLKSGQIINHYNSIDMAEIWCSKFKHKQFSLF